MTFFGTDSILTLHIKKLGCYVFKERIEKVCEGKDTIRFIFMGDTQRSYNETEDFVKYVNQLDSIDFIIHGGDYTEFGLKKEFEWNDDILSKLKVPYVGLIGNHDVIGNGDQVFRKIFGNENFSFVVSDVKFVCLNTNAIEYDYSHPVPDFNFLKNEIADSTRNKRTIVVMHAPPGNEQFYYGCANIAKRSYLLFTLTPDDYIYEVVNF